MGQPESGGARRRWPLALFVAISLVVFVPAVTHDLRDNVPYGDQTSHMYLALSVAYDSHTLNFDRRDSVRWGELKWTAEPYTLFFQRYDGGWAASKPYGYPLYLAPFIAVLGPVTGVAVGNTLLLVLLVAGSLALALRRLDSLTAVLVVDGSIRRVHLHVRVPGDDGAVPGRVGPRGVRRGLPLPRDRPPRLGGGCGGGDGVRGGREGGAARALRPLACVVVWELRQRRWVAGAVVAAGLATVAVAVLPYLKYSGGETFTPYAGARYQTFATAQARPPWEGGQLNTDYHPSAADEGTIARRAISGSVVDRLESLAYYVVGRHTGLLVTAPFALLLLVALLVRLPASDRWAVAGLLGILFYIAFYLVLFPKNFYGGGQSLGNRYFVQIAPAVLVTALFGPLGTRLLRRLALVGIVLSAVLNVPHHLHPQTAYIKMLRTSAPQRLLPIEANQDYIWIFRQLPPPGAQ